MDEEKNSTGERDPLAGLLADRRKFLKLVLAGSVVAAPVVQTVGLSGAVAATQAPNVSGATTRSGPGTNGSGSQPGTTTPPPATTRATTTGVDDTSAAHDRDDDADHVDDAATVNHADDTSAAHDVQPQRPMAVGVAPEKWWL
jgi:hypothetical protein